MKEFWMIRHAESQANAGDRTVNQLSTYLSDVGIRQAEELKKYLSNQKRPDLIVTSKYPRTRLTAEPYLDLHDSKYHEWDIHEFSYLSQVKYENTTFEERMEPKNAYWEASDPHYRDGAGAESYSDLLHRVERMLRMILERKEERIWLFTHGQFMKAVICLLMTEGLEGKQPDIKKFKNFMDNHDVHNCGLVRVRIDKGSYWLSFQNIWSL